MILLLVIFSSTETEDLISGTDGITDLSIIVIRLSSVHPSVNFYFKSRLLFKILSDHSDFFTGETRHRIHSLDLVGCRE